MFFINFQPIFQGLVTMSSKNRSKHNSTKASGKAKDAVKNEKGAGKSSEEFNFCLAMESAVNGEDIERIMSVQNRSLKNFAKTNELLGKFNDFSSSKYDVLQHMFAQHTRLLADLKKELTNVFLRIRRLKARLQKQYPLAFEATFNLRKDLEVRLEQEIPSDPTYATREDVHVAENKDKDRRDKDKIAATEFVEKKDIGDRRKGVAVDGRDTAVDRGDVGISETFEDDEYAADRMKQLNDGKNADSEKALCCESSGLLNEEYQEAEVIKRELDCVATSDQERVGVVNEGRDETGKIVETDENTKDAKNDLDDEKIYVEAEDSLQKDEENLAGKLEESGGIVKNIEDNQDETEGTFRETKGNFEKHGVQSEEDDVSFEIVEDNVEEINDDLLEDAASIMKTENNLIKDDVERVDRDLIDGEKR